MSMKYFLTLALLISLSLTGTAQSCKDLPNRFNSYSEAITAINDADFNYTDKLPEGKSSWITDATFYSCDDKTGYMVYTTVKGGNTYMRECLKAYGMSLKQHLQAAHITITT